MTVAGYRLTRHSYMRFLNGELTPTNGKAATRLLEQLLTNMFLVKRRNSAAQIIDHGFDAVRYFWSDGWVFVVNELEPVIITCYHKDGTPEECGYDRN